MNEPTSVSVKPAAGYRLRALISRLMHSLEIIRPVLQLFTD